MLPSSWAALASCIFPACPHVTGFSSFPKRTFSSAPAICQLSRSPSKASTPQRGTPACGPAWQAAMQLSRSQTSWMINPQSHLQPRTPCQSLLGLAYGGCQFDATQRRGVSWSRHLYLGDAIRVSRCAPGRCRTLPPCRQQRSDTPWSCLPHFSRQPSRRRSHRSRLRAAG